MLSAPSAFPNQTSPTGKVKSPAPMVHLCSHAAANLSTHLSCRVRSSSPVPEDQGSPRRVEDGPESDPGLFLE